MLNQFGLEVLSPELLAKFMGNNLPEKQMLPFMLQLALDNQDKMGVPSMEDRDTKTNMPDDFWAPQLAGSNIAEHFEAMADEFLELYGIWPKWNAMLEPVIEPPPADQLAMAQPGWNRYELVGDNWQHAYCDAPCESSFTFDCETFVQGSEFSMPIIGTATSNKAHYVWISPQLRYDGFTYCTLVQQLAKAFGTKVWPDLDLQGGEFHLPTAPLPSLGRDKFVIMHNSAFDACRYEERYHIGNPFNVWCFCTMSAITVTNGYNSGQRWVQNYTPEPGKFKPAWAKHGTGKSLYASYIFATGKQWPDSGDKDLRGIFVTASSLSVIRAQWAPLMGYAMNDAICTAELFAYIGPQYLKHTSKPTLVAHMLLANSLAPIDNKFKQWLDDCQQAFEANRKEMASIFKQLAYKYLEEWWAGADPNCDPWLCKLDWRVKGTWKGKPVPYWYHDMRTNGITTKQSLSHYLAKLMWDGNPVRKLKKHGWCYLDADGPIAEEGHNWSKVPHPKTAGSNVGGLLNIDFLHYVEQGTLQGSGDAHRLIELNYEASWWVTAGNRIREMAIRTTTNPLNGNAQLVVAPKVVAHNTVSYRTGENLLLTLPSRVKDKIAFELKSKIVAPPGYDLVYYDFDSQELQVLSAYADSYVGISGSAPFSVTVLVGSKGKGTDMHTLVAKRASEATGIKVLRDAGKQSVYAMCYGATTKTVAATIRIWHPTLEELVVLNIAKPILSAFKGNKGRGEEYYSGGLASQAFNAMHDLLQAREPSTPLLFNKMPKPMWPTICGQTDSPAQLNWGVQSAGASMLQCSIVGAWWLAHRSGIKATLCVTIHDELCWMVPKTHSKDWAYLLTIGHIWDWCLLHYNLGIYDMPVKRALQEGIGIDRVFRKSPYAEVITITNPGGFSPGKEVAPLELLAMSDQMQTKYHNCFNAHIGV